MSDYPAYVFHGPTRAKDEESWSGPLGFSVALHVFLSVLFIFSTGHKPEISTVVLTEVNFMEKPVVVELPSQGDAAVDGISEMSAQAVIPGAVDQVVSFTPQATNVPVTVDPVAAPIISAPIAPSGEMGMLGRKKGAIAPIGGSDAIKVKKKGPIALPSSGGKKGQPLALATQNVNAIKSKGGVGLPLISQRVGGGGSGGALKPLAGGGALSRPGRAPMEKLQSNPMEKDNFGKRKSPFSLEGPLKYRRIKKTSLPPYPRWAEEKAISASVSFRVWVSPNGLVKKNLYLEKTSGYTQLDNLAKEALLKFVFVPIPKGQPQEDEWGVATFRFELKK